MSGKGRRAFQSFIASVLFAWPLPADSIPVRHIEGRVHGFLVLLDGNNHILAGGDVTQLATANRVTSELVLRFRDGSLHEETTVYSQRRTFRLLTYRLVQKGGSFKRPMDMSLNALTGQVTVHYTGADGKQNSIADHLQLPPDLANGMVPTLLSAIDRKTPKTIVSMLVATPKPRLVKLVITPQGEEPFSIAGAPSKASRYAVKVDIGGVAGVIAPIVGKQPPDTHIWIAAGNVPGFLKSEGPLFEDGPIWRIELTSPEWPR